MSKTMAAGIAALLAVAVVVVLADGSADRDPAALPTYWQAPTFALVQQDGDTLRSGDLLGHPWVASFVFTSCTGVCPLITTRMAQLRDSLETQGHLGHEVRLVSFSVDPARDTPPALQEYAARFGGSPPEDWAFLTGSPPEAVRTLIQEGFRLTALAPDDAPGEESASSQDERPASEAERGAGGYQVSHSPRVLLLDERGLVRGIYQGTDPEMPDEILEDLRRLEGR